MLAGTGHLVLATLHANNAAETLDRIINMFPLEQHTQIFLDISQYLRAIIAQRLVPGKNKRRVAAVELLKQVQAQNFPRLQTIFGDSKYHNHAREDGLAKNRAGWRIEVKAWPEGTKGFLPVRKRWVVERTNAWNGRARRNSKDYERKPASAVAMIHLSNIHLMLRKLAPSAQREFRYNEAA